MSANNTIIFIKKYSLNTLNQMKNIVSIIIIFIFHSCALYNVQQVNINVESTLFATDSSNKFLLMIEDTLALNEFKFIPRDIELSIQNKIVKIDNSDIIVTAIPISADTAKFALFCWVAIDSIDTKNFQLACKYLKKKCLDSINPIVNNGPNLLYFPDVEHDDNGNVNFNIHVARLHKQGQEETPTSESLRLVIASQNGNQYWYSNPGANFMQAFFPVKPAETGTSHTFKMFWDGTTTNKMLLPPGKYSGLITIPVRSQTAYNYSYNFDFYYKSTYKR